MARMMLSTLDNPFNPFKQYDMWSAHDKNIGGYNSAELLARFAPVYSDETKEEAEANIENAIDDIIELDLPIFNPLTGERTYYIKFNSKQKR